MDIESKNRLQNNNKFTVYRAHLTSEYKKYKED